MVKLERRPPMRKLARLLLALLLVAFLAGIARVAQEVEPAGAKMARAGETFVSSLDADQKAKAIFDFDDKERINWHFVPLQDKEKKSTRKGLPFVGRRSCPPKAVLCAWTSFPRQGKEVHAQRTAFGGHERRPTKGRLGAYQG